MSTLLRIFLLGSVSCLMQLQAHAQDAPVDEKSLQTFIVPMAPLGDGIRDYHYFSPLLELALNKTLDTDGPYRLEQARNILTENRLKAALRLGHVDVIWSATTSELEQTLLPIPVSLLKEFGDYRILVIRPEDQHRFDEVSSLSDLRKFTGGIGSQWADVDIMRANDLPVVSAVGYERLFKMLAAKRFDYFSRGLYQVQREIEMRPKFVMEENLMLYYPSPFYFFVNRSNSALADRIERGLRIAIEDGSFDELFFSVSRHQWARDELNKNHRRVIKLDLPGKAPERTGH